jgi:uracil-DNA glycosylase
MKNIHNADNTCPNCGKLLISPFGNPASPYLIVGDFPGYQETMQRVPFTFRQPPVPGRRQERPRAGDILKDELNRVGVSLNSVLLTNLWLHQQEWKTEVIGKKKRQVEACPLSWHLDQLAKMFENRTHVLLMGSSSTEALLGVKVNVVSGLQVKVPGFRKVHFWVSPNPALVMAQPIGEFRLALERFANDILGAC